MTELLLNTQPGHSLHLVLFKDVRNSRELLELMQTGVLTPELAFLNAALVSDTFPILAAAHKALLAQSRQTLATRTLHAEIIYNYAGSKHISESLRRCGITDSTSYILVARFDASDDEIAAIRKLVQGTEVSISELAKRADRAQILKHYKISSHELEVSTLEDAVTCRIAARDAL